MNILFIHQGFSGQYKHIIKELAKNNQNKIVGLGINPLKETLPDGVKYYQYRINRGNTPGIHEWLLDMDSKQIRAEACAKAAYELKGMGFTPHLICAHPGWGEALLIKQVWENVPLLCYQEFFYNTKGFDHRFDKRESNTDDWGKDARIVFKKANPLIMLEESDWNITPTEFQRSSFPSTYHNKFSVIHDGIDIDTIETVEKRNRIEVAGNIIENGDKIVTFVNRNIEPYRGCETMIKAIPKILGIDDRIKIVIVGNEDGVSYGKANEGESWKNRFLREIQGKYEKERVIFTGSIEYKDYIKILKLSNCHIYLTYPFVLSWSMLEAMSIGLPVIGSNTEPVREVIDDGNNGVLTDFFNESELATNVEKLIKDKELSEHIGKNAQKTIIQKYSLRKCLPKQIALINLMARS